MAQQAVVPLKEQPCPVHKNGKICMVCKDCDFQKVCLICIATTHQGHRCTVIEEYVKTKKDSLQCLLEDVKDFRADLETRLQKTRAAGEWASSNSNTVKNQLTRQAERMKHLIDEWLIKGHLECDTVYIENSKIIDGIEKQLADRLHVLVSAITRSEVALTSNSYEDVTLLQEALSSQTNAVKITMPVLRELQLTPEKDVAPILGTLKKIEFDTDLQRCDIEINPEKIHRKEENKYGMILGNFRGTPISIHEFKPHRMSITQDDFLKQVQILRQLCHPNVVYLHGVITDVDNPAIVLEVTSKGFMNDMNKEMASHPLSLQIDFATQVASGMEYISSKRIIHRNLKTKSILMTNKTTVKIANFYLAVELGDDSEQWNGQEGTKFPTRWSAIECFEKMTFSVASDVWSFGVLVWEIMSKGKVPYAGVKEWEVADYICAGQILQKPQQCPENVYEVLQKCWLKDPNQRPTFEELKQIFGDILLSVNTTTITGIPSVKVRTDTTSVSTQTPGDTNQVTKKKSVFQIFLK